MKHCFLIPLFVLVCSGCGRTIVDPPDPVVTNTVSATEEKFIGNWHLFREVDTAFFNGGFGTSECTYTSDFHANFLRTRNGPVPAGLSGEAVKQVLSSALFSNHGYRPEPNNPPHEVTDYWFVNSAGRLYAGQYYWDILSVTGSTFTIQYAFFPGGNRKTFTFYFRKIY